MEALKRSSRIQDVALYELDFFNGLFIAYFLA